jgi:hypothetical protein
MSTAMATVDYDLPENQKVSADILEKVLLGGDLSKLTSEQRVQYYMATCKSLGLNPLTKPFDYLTLQGEKLTLYPKRDCTDQLRKIHHINLRIVSREKVGDAYVVTAQATIGDRYDESTGVVSVFNLKGEALANAYMKAETKAKRRVTLSIAGLGWADETEVETIPGSATGETRPQLQQKVRPAILESTVPSGVVAEDHALIDVVHPTAEQVNSLAELMRAGGLDVNDQMRSLLRLPQDAVISKKTVRETMTMEQYDTAWLVYSNKLKEDNDQDVADFSGPDPSQQPHVEEQGSGEGSRDSDGTEVSQESSKTVGDHAESDRSDNVGGTDTYQASAGFHTSDMHEAPDTPPVVTPTGDQASGSTTSESKDATPWQIARLKLLAKKVGDDAYVDLQDAIDHHGGKLTLQVYQGIRERLVTREAEQKNASEA